MYSRAELHIIIKSKYETSFACVTLSHTLSDKLS